MGEPTLENLLVGEVKLEKEFEKYLSKLTCRGCYNYCNLNSPNCGRSLVFIKDAKEKFKEGKRVESKKRE